MRIMHNESATGGVMTQLFGSAISLNVNVT
jgi:hypothetical protein